SVSIDSILNVYRHDWPRPPVRWTYPDGVAEDQSMSWGQFHILVTISCNMSRGGLTIWKLGHCPRAWGQ
ncbi:unnamed protein product, partial [Staurois parvus]